LALQWIIVLILLRLNYLVAVAVFIMQTEELTNDLNSLPSMLRLCPSKLEVLENTHPFQISLDQERFP
jgi:hypothetical protein